jgi:coenzyme F420-reducing hydrogenase beta subunit
MTFVTVAGHPLAGSVTFRFVGIPGSDLRFEVETCDRPATVPDALSMLSIGAVLKRWNWTTVVSNTAEGLGAMSPVTVQADEFPLSESEEREAVVALRQKVSKLARDEEPGLREEAKGRVEEAFKPA